MKKSKIKLSLKKRTITNLNEIRGGVVAGTYLTVCITTSIVPNGCNTEGNCTMTCTRVWC